MDERSRVAGLRRLLAVQVAALFACVGVELLCRFALHLGGPYVWPLLNDKTFFADFNLLAFRFAHLHSRDFYYAPGYTFMYPPGAGLVYAAFYPLPTALPPRDPRSWVYAGSLVSIFLAGIGFFLRALVKRGVTPLRAAGVGLAAILCSYPFWFDYQRGNIEVYVWAICALGCWAFYRNRGYSAAACFALAGSMKLYPVMYLGLFLSQKKWRELAFGVGAFFFSFVAALWVLCPHIRWAAHQTALGLKAFSIVYSVVDPVVLGYDHSLFTLIKYVGQHQAQIYRESVIYTLIVAPVGLALYVLRIRKARISYQVAALTCAIILLPPVSFDYTLLHVYTAIGFLLFSEWGGESPVVLRLLGLLALAASPLSEFVFHGRTVEGQLKALILLAAFLLATFAGQGRSSPEAPIY